MRCKSRMPRAVARLPAKSLPASARRSQKFDLACRTFFFQWFSVQKISLAPGFSPVISHRRITQAVSTALLSREKPLKRLPSFCVFNTGLKPGVNEKKPRKLFFIRDILLCCRRRWCRWSRSRNWRRGGSGCSFRLRFGVRFCFCFRSGFGFGLGFGFFSGDDSVRIGGIMGMKFLVVSVRLGEFVLGQQQAAEAIGGAQLKLCVHLDGLERADLDANLAAHANGNINVKRERINLRLALVIGLLVLALDDVNALGRTFLLTNLAGHAAQALFPIVTVIDEERKLSRVLLRHEVLFGILHGGEPFLRDVTPEEILGGHRHAFDDLLAEHEIRKLDFLLGNQETRKFLTGGKQRTVGVQLEVFGWQLLSH